MATQRGYIQKDLGSREKGVRWRSTNTGLGLLEQDAAREVSSSGTKGLSMREALCVALTKRRVQVAPRRRSAEQGEWMLPRGAVRPRSGFRPEFTSADGVDVERGSCDVGPLQGRRR